MTTKENRERLSEALARMPLKEKIDQLEKRIESLELHIKIIKDAATKVIYYAKIDELDPVKDFSLITSLKQLQIII